MIGRDYRPYRAAGDKLRDLRHETGLSLSGAAYLAGLTKHYLSRIECGYMPCSLRHAIALSRIGIDMVQIIAAYEEYAPPPPPIKVVKLELGKLTLLQRHYIEVIRERNEARVY